MLGCFLRMGLDSSYWSDFDSYLESSLSRPKSLSLSSIDF